MNEAKEAAARVAIADFETRRAEARADVLATRWRLAGTAISISAFLAVALYIRLTKMQISGAEASGFLLIYAIYAARDHYQTHEKLHELKAELDRLRNSIRDKE